MAVTIPQSAGIGNLELGWRLSCPAMLSFVIPAHNEADFVGPTIDAIRAACAELKLDGDCEIIVVDDASTDATASVARSRGARVLTVRKRQIAAVRNAGAAAAAGDVLVFVDADTTVDPALLRAALRALEEGAVGGGAYVAFDDRVPPLAHAVLRFWNVVARLAAWAAGCFIFVRRDAFEAAGGFDEAFYASEEVRLSQALKRRGRFVLLGRHVLTSARKAKQHSSRDLLALLWYLFRAGRAACRRREGLELWYEPDRGAADQA